MSKNFKTVGEAVNFCAEHGLKKSSVSDDLFDTADALLSAYRAGQSISNRAINEMASEMGGFCIVEGKEGDGIPALRLPPKGLELSKLS